jgi:KaiC/GvpD/RAD55 family RecA-like ATPase
VYPSIDVLNQVIARHYPIALMKKNEKQSFSHYETLEEVRSALIQGGVDVSKYEGEGSLIICDSAKAYTRINGVYDLEVLVNILLERVEKLNKAGLLVMADMGSFLPS